MSSTKHKRAGQNKSRGHARKKRYDPDRHRWRKVATALLSVLFFVPFSLCFYVHGIWFVWSVIACVAILLWLALVLLEWHVWKRTLLLPRLALMFIFGALVVGGFKWQSKIRLPVPHRPWLRFTDDERRKFVSVLTSQVGARDHVRLACPAANEDICVLAAPFINDFKRGHFFVEDGGMSRITLGMPTSGVVLTTYGHADAFDPQDPDQGKWVRQTDSMTTIEDAFAAVDVNAGGLADESMPQNVIMVYFGIEADEATDNWRAERRRQMREAQQQYERRASP